MALGVIWRMKIALC